MQATEVGFVVTAISVDYHSPAFLDDVLSVITTVEQLKRFSMTFLQKIERDGQKIATLKVKVASISQKSLKPIPLESWFTEAVNAL
ncbi:MAG: acyl-CoA thioesterase [Sphaerochaetaceae bacterium]